MIKIIDSSWDEKEDSDLYFVAKVEYPRDIIIDIFVDKHEADYDRADYGQFLGQEYVSTFGNVMFIPFDIPGDWNNGIRYILINMDTDEVSVRL